MKSLTGNVVDATLLYAEFPGIGIKAVTITGDLKNWTRRLHIGERVTITSVGKDWPSGGKRGLSTIYITKAKAVDNAPHS